MAADKGFVASMKNLCKEFEPDVVALLEPRVSGNKARRIVKNLGFGHYEMVDARGFAGGIWLMWKDEGLDFKIIEKHEQYVHVCFSPGTEEEWFFMVMYACPREAGRIVLWENMKRIAGQMNRKWLVAGDFNEIADPREQKGGT